MSVGRTSLRANYLLLHELLRSFRLRGEFIRGAPLYANAKQDHGLGCLHALGKLVWGFDFMIMPPWEATWFNPCSLHGAAHTFISRLIVSLRNFWLLSQASFSSLSNSHPHFISHMFSTSSGSLSGSFIFSFMLFSLFILDYTVAV